MPGNCKFYFATERLLITAVQNHCLEWLEIKRGYAFVDCVFGETGDIVDIQFFHN